MLGKSFKLALRVGKANLLPIARRATCRQEEACFCPTFRPFQGCAEFSFYSCRYLHSLVETFLIYQHFHKAGTEQPWSKQELVDFWMDFLVEATKRDVSSVRFPVSWKSPQATCQTKGSGWGGAKPSLICCFIRMTSLICPPGADFRTDQNLPAVVSVHQQRCGGQHGLHLACCP